MAYTDWSATAGWQPRIWAVDIDGQLLSKRIDINEDAWTLYTATGLSEDVAGVSYSDGGTQRERVFFVQSSQIRFLPVDSGTVGAVTSLPSSGFSIESGTDLAAVTFLDGSTQRIAVAGRFASGRLCIWEGTYTGFTTSPWCSATSVASGLDLDGGVLSAAPSTPSFFFQSSTGLTRARRTGASAYSITNLGLPPSTTSLRPSVYLTTSVISSSRFEVAVLSNSGAHTARVNATEAAVSVWTSLGFPSGETMSNDPESVGIARWFNGVTDPRMTLYIKPADNELWFVGATSSAWSTSWSQSVPPQGDRFFGVGAAVEVPSTTAGLSGGVAYGPTGAFALVVAYYHLGEYDRTSFDDHLTYQVQPGTSVLGFGETDPNTPPSLWFSSNETTAAVYGLAGLATGIRRNGDPPWEVTVANTTNAGFSYSDGFVINPVPTLSTTGARDSLTDPYTACSPNSTLAFHLSLQVPVAGFSSACFPEVTTRQMVIRRGSDANAIADLTPSSSNLAVLASGELDHGGIAVTGTSGSELAHAVWWNKGMSRVEYSQWSSGAAPTPTVLTDLPSLPAGVFRDGSTGVWGWSNVTGWPTICEIYPSISHVCGSVTNNAGAPIPNAPAITFGSIGTFDDAIARNCAVAGGQFQQCFETEQPVALFAHPVSGRVYAAWQGLDASSQGGASTSIYFSRTTDATLDAWTTPVRVNPRVANSTTFYIDSAITVDQSGFVLVTYSAIERGQASPTATVHTSFSSNNGTTFTLANRAVPPTWRPADLSIHCSRHKYFLGEYREGSTFGEKHYQTYQHSYLGRVTQVGLWSSRRSVW